MNRKEFLSLILKRVIRPAILLSVVLFSMYFLYKVVSENGPERFSSLLIICLGFVFWIAYLMGLIFKQIGDFVINRLPKNMLSGLKRFNKILGYLSPVLFLLSCYLSWANGGNWGIVMMVLVLAENYFWKKSRI